eukprot:1639123-Karenia_brevis.AAC.1
MGRIRHAQRLADRMYQRKHMVQQAGVAVGAAVGISMCEAAAVSDGPSPYYALSAADFEAAVRAAAKES